MTTNKALCVGSLRHPRLCCPVVMKDATACMRQDQVLWSDVAGVIAYGIDRAGNHVRASGWGPAFLDGGCGYDIGQRALAAVARAADGRGPTTALTAALYEACRASLPEELIRCVPRCPTPVVQLCFAMYPHSLLIWALFRACVLSLGLQSWTC